MNYTKELNLTEFKFWSGAKQHEFTYNELKQLEYILEDLYYEKQPTETDINNLFWFEEELLCELLGIDFNEYENRQDMIKISITTALKIIRSNKDFIFYRVEGSKMVDFTLTNDISRFRNQYNNKFKIVSDIKKQINNNLKIEL